MKLLLSSITIGPRQRKDIGDLDELAESLKTVGQIHSIGVRQQDNRLIWGYRRYCAAKQLGWPSIEAVVREDMTPELEQEIELEEDIRRKDRTWQEYSLSIMKIFFLKRRAARANGKDWTVRNMADYTGLGKSMVADYVFNVGAGLLAEPKDEKLWACGGILEAITLCRTRKEAEARIDIDARNKKLAEIPKQFTQVKSADLIETDDDEAPSSVQQVDNTPKKLLLSERARIYNEKFKHLGPPNTDLFYMNRNGREFITGFWFVSGGNIGELYGSYQIEYLKRIETLFPDAKAIIHLFSGNIPPSPHYIRVGLPEGDFVPDIQSDAHKLSSTLTFKADLIYADPPYSHEDAEHYSDSMVNESVCLEEAALCLEKGGFIVWMSQTLPIHKSELIQLAGSIGYIRSTANRFRMICLFKRV